MDHPNHNPRWLFFHDRFGAWQWAKLDRKGKVVKTSYCGHGSLEECIKDARRNGCAEPVYIRGRGKPVDLKLLETAAPRGERTTLTASEFEFGN